jgi:hypothetical protein
MKFTPAAMTWTSACPGPGRASETSCTAKTSGPPNALITTAFIVFTAFNSVSVE